MTRSYILLKKCSFCGKELEKSAVVVELNTKALRMKSTGIWEKIDNFYLHSKEIICEECFSKFINAMEDWKKK